MTARLLLSSEHRGFCPEGVFEWVVFGRRVCFDVDALHGAGQFRLPAYHRHLLGGAHGILEIGPDGIQFKTDKKADSRTWLYRDIQTIGRAGPFNFRISTDSETYNFDLKERLQERAYDLAWSRLYNFLPVQAHPTESGETVAEGFGVGRVSR